MALLCPGKRAAQLRRRKYFCRARSGPPVPGATVARRLAGKTGRRFCPGAWFLNEARAVNLVQHPGLVEIYEFGELEDGAAFIVMELLQGQTLRARLQQGERWQPAAAAALGQQLALALQAAHDCGVIHRDLKPDNVMLVPDRERPRQERVKILDFGIAKLQGVDAAELPSGPSPQTRSGVAMGTPAYMAPEQCQDAGHVDAKVDVYALGVMLYELLAGQPPFAAENSVELMMLQLKAAPRPIKELVPTVPDALAALLHQMLAKMAIARPPMGEIAERLLELLPGTPTTALTTLDGNGGRSGAEPQLAGPVLTRSTFPSIAGEASVHPRPRRRAVALFLSLSLGAAAAGVVAIRSVSAPKNGMSSHGPSASTPWSPPSAGSVRGVTTPIAAPAEPPDAGTLPQVAIKTAIETDIKKEPGPVPAHRPPSRSERPPIRFRDKDPDVP